LQRLFLGARGLACKFLGKRIVGAFLVPQDADNPPAAAIIEHLNAVDAACERSFTRSVAGLVAAKDLSDISERFDAIHDRTLVKGVLKEVVACGLGIVFDAHRANAGGTVSVLRGGSEAGLRQEEGTEAIPIALARRTGNHTVERCENAVDRLHVVGACSGGAG